MLEKAAKHQIKEHPKEVIRQPYPNEGAFRAWCRDNGYKIEETETPNEPLVINYTELKQIELHSNGVIILKQQGIFTGPNDGSVTNTGDQLKSEDGYISTDAFPIDKNSY